MPKNRLTSVITDMENRLIFRIFKVCTAIHQLPLHYPVTPSKIGSDAGVDTESIPNYVQHAIFYQNFFPRIFARFGNGKINKVERIGFPAAYDFLLRPAEGLLLKLWELEAYSGNFVPVCSLLLTRAQNESIYSLEEEGKIKIQNNGLSLTSDGVKSALDAMEIFVEDRKKCVYEFHDIVNVLNVNVVADERVLDLEMPYRRAAVARRRIMMPRILLRR